MSVERNLPLVRERRTAALAGDAELIKKQHEAGKLTARERIAHLFDDASFVELDTLIADAGVVTGYGLINNQPAYVYAQDYTVASGAVGAAQAGKILKVMGLAGKTGAPVIALCDSQGARLDEGMTAVNAYASIMAKSAELSGVVPQISIVLGPCGGGAALCASLSDIVIMSKNGQLFLNGPLVVSAATGKNISMEDMAGAKASVKNGTAAIACESDEDAIDAARKLIAMLPANNLDEVPVDVNDNDDVNRAVESLNAIDTVEDIKAVIADVADEGSVVELGDTFAEEMFTGFARLGGFTVGIVANQAGSVLTAKGCKKAARFAGICDSFSIPVITFVDAKGTDAAGCQACMTKAAATLMAAYAGATIPRISVIYGSAIGSAATALASHAAADVIYAWPGAVISPVTAAIAVQLKDEDKLAKAADPQAKRAELEKDYQDNVADGINAALTGNVDDVIEPALTRQYLAAALEMLAGKREIKPERKHGNLPL